jgi:hypothetical protein
MNLALVGAFLFTGGAVSLLLTAGFCRLFRIERASPLMLAWLAAPQAACAVAFFVGALS